MVAGDDRNVEESAPWPHCRPVLSSHTAAGNYLEVLLLTLVVLVAALLIRAKAFLSSRVMIAGEPPPMNCDSRIRVTRSRSAFIPLCASATCCRPW